MASKAKILITGSTGTVGTEIRRQLLEKKVPFRALVHSESKIPLVVGVGVEAAVGDFDRPETLRGALRGIERMFLVSGSDLKQVEREKRMVDLAKAEGVKHVVMLSVMGAALDSAVSLVRWHAQIEKHLENSGLTYTHLRPNYFMQNLLRSAPGMLEQGVFYGSVGESHISMIDATDIASVAVRCLLLTGCENKMYELTGPEAISMADVATEVSKVLGRSVSYVNVPFEESRKAMLGAGMPAWYTDALLDLNRSFLEGFGSKVTQAVPDITGKPAHKFNEFARRFSDLGALPEKKAA
jgi:uncharacterized protein YbjT (DUF2867 family)